jgi:hypothetical protein
MFRFAFCVLCVFVLIAPSFSQIPDSTDEELPPPSRAAAKFGGGIGFTPSLLSMDIAPINEWLRNANAGELSSGPVFLTGGQAYGYILFVQNLRGGIMWGSGSKSSLVTSNNITRDVKVHVGFTGGTIEYVIPLHPRLDVTIGGMLGAGGMDITMKLDSNLQTRSWNHIWNEFGTAAPAPQYSHKMTGTFFIYEPMVNVEYAALRWLGFRVGAGYLGMAGNSWELDDKYTVPDVPSNINGKGFTFNAGVFLGTFIF